MAMKPALALRLGQQLRMTPQLQQAIKLLQLSSLDLQQEIQEAVYFIKEHNMAIGPRLVMPIRTILQEEVCLHADGIEEVKS